MDYENAIAVVGLACRYPGAKNVSKFWQQLSSQADCISRFTDEELGKNRFLESNENSSYVKARGVLGNAECWDAGFWGVLPKQAKLLDPQQRLFLECAWEAMEDAGYAVDRINNSVSVFAGVGENSYYKHLLRYTDSDSLGSQLELIIHNEKDFIATRTAYKLGLTGPCMNIQTACSTSLVAVHCGVQSLLNGECDLAIVGGASIHYPEVEGYLHQKDNIGAPDGKCRAFDEKAQGTVPGNGVGAVVLKRMDEAVAEGDNIHAVVLGSAVNNDGSNKVGFTAPSVEGQASVIAEAIGISEIEADSVQFIETHGTGTHLGDPVEIQALKKVYGNRTTRLLGAVKSNIGHTDAAAGIAGFIKTVLSLKNKQIPGNLHFEKANPKLNLEESGFKVCERLTEWKSPGGPRRGAVSSFGIGGTNAHVILEEAPVIVPEAKNDETALLTLSAKTEDALKEYLRDMSQTLQESSENEGNIAWTMQVGRNAFDYRKVFVGCRKEEWRKGIESVLEHAAFEPSLDSPQVAFVFPGQGSYCFGIARELYGQKKASVFNQQLDRCESYLRAHGVSVLPYLLGTGQEVELKQTTILQPVLFSYQYALANLWMGYGVKPAALLGHSVGEWVAACIAGVLSLEDALGLIVARGRLMETVKGTMLACMLSAEELEACIDASDIEGLSIAASNAAKQTVVSGGREAIKAFIVFLNDKGITHTVINDNYAFHGCHDKGLAMQFEAKCREVNWQSPRFKFISCLNGEFLTGDDFDWPSHWSNHLFEKVDFHRGIKKCIEEDTQVFLGMESDGAFARLVKNNLQRHSSAQVLASMQAENLRIELTLGRLWELGVEINWDAYHQGVSYKRVSMPTYPFQRKPYQAPVFEQEPDNGEMRKIPQKTKGEAWTYRKEWQRLSIKGEGKQAGKDTKYLFVNEGQPEAMELLRAWSLNEVTILNLSENSFQDKKQRFEDWLDQVGRTLGDIVENETKLKILYYPDCDRSSFKEEIGLLDQFNNSHDFVYFLGEYLKEYAVQLVLVTNREYVVLGNELKNGNGALVSGLVRVAEQEFNHLETTHLDIVLSNVTKEIELDALFRSCSGNDLLAYRGHSFWKPDYVAQLASVQKNGGFSGTVLITGGLGGLGVNVAKGMAEQGSKCVVLAQRKPFVEKENWRNYLEQNDQASEIRNLIETLREIEEMGCEVIIEVMDVTQLEECQRVIERLEHQGKQVDGVIHAAGVWGGSLIISEDDGANAQILEPKVMGVKNLHEIFRERALEFFCVFSSLTTELGGIGQSAYCSANKYLEHYGQWMSDNGMPVLCIHWDGWKRVGMAYDARNEYKFVGERLKQEEQFYLEPEIGVDALLTLINKGKQGSYIISCGDLEKRIQFATVHYTRSNDFMEQGLLEDNQLVVTEKSVSKDQVEVGIRDIWCENLGLSKIGVQEDFLELGGDSLLAIQILDSIGKRFDIKISLAEIFEYRTIESQTKLIHSLLEKSCETVDDVSELVDELSELSSSEIEGLFLNEDRVES